MASTLWQFFELSNAGWNFSRKMDRRRLHRQTAKFFGAATLAGKVESQQGRQCPRKYRRDCCPCDWPRTTALQRKKLPPPGLRVELQLFPSNSPSSVRARAEQ